MAEDTSVAFLEASYIVITFNLAARRGLVVELDTNFQMRSRAVPSHREANFERPNHQCRPGGPVTRHHASHIPAAANAEMKHAGVGEPEQLPPPTSGFVTSLQLRTTATLKMEARQKSADSQSGYNHSRKDLAKPWTRGHGGDTIHSSGTDG